MPKLLLKPFLIRLWLAEGRAVYLIHTDSLRAVGGATGYLITRRMVVLATTLIVALC